MAEVKVNKPSSEKQQPEQQRGRSLVSRGDFPSMFMMHPREFFNQSPFSLMRRFSEEMDRTFGSLFRESPEMAGWAPVVEVREREGNLVVCADLPGLNKEDVKVEATDEGLVIQGERKREQEERKEGMYRSERSYGQFYRLIPLPEGANIEQTKANFNNGVLEITVPVPAAQQKRREIPIEAGGEKTRGSGGGA